MVLVEHYQDSTTRNAGRSQAGWKQKGGGRLLTAVLVMLSLTFSGQAAEEGFDPTISDEAVAAPVQAAPGDLDASFSGDGKVLTDFSGADSLAYALAIQPDSKIVVAGAGGAGSDFALARYLPNGTLDSTFSGDGKLTTDFGISEIVFALALQPDGKIVAAGQSAYLSL